MIRAAVKIAYLGEDYYGSQAQPGLRTVEGDVLTDIRTVADLPDEEIDLKLASRTDRGVNALGNVAVFSSGIDDPDILLKALNAVSRGVYYRGAALVDKDFNPRLADVRTYRYVLPARGMDISGMKRCAELFTGEHDFKRFCRADGKPTVLTLDSVGVRTENGLVAIDFSARYYLWNMIRRIAAAFMAVGRGDSALSDVKEALEGRDVTFGVARADALTLTEIRYAGVDFKPPSENVFERRIEEESFKDTLHSLFFESL